MTLHTTHNTRTTDASSFDYICRYCGETDSLGSWDKLEDPCVKNYEAILNHYHAFTDTNITSIREYLHELLTTLWCETDEFSGKRPFGNSGWEYELYEALINYSSVFGTLDSDGFVQHCKQTLCDGVIFNCIDYLFDQKES